MENLTGTTPSLEPAKLVPKSATDIDTQLWIYISPIILIVGLCGNILTLIVMRRKRLRGTTTAVYLPLIAIADSFVLLFGIIPEWLNNADIIVTRELHPMACKFEKFLNYLVGDTAVWLLCGFTMDRFIAICFPLKKRAICTPKRALICGLLLFILAIGKNLNVFWTRGAEYKVIDNVTMLATNCGKVSEQARHFSSFIRPWIAFTMVFVLPFIIIVICNICILHSIMKMSNLRRATEAATKKTAVGPTNQNGRPSVLTSSVATGGSRDKVFLQTVVMCLSISFAFLICITPSIVLLIMKPYVKKDSVSYEIAKAVNNQIFYINHAINFFLYCLTGKRFREELFSVFGGCGCRKKTDTNRSLTPLTPTTPNSNRNGSQAQSPMTQNTSINFSEQSSNAI